MNSNNNNLLVSISTITYNHAPFIRQCLDGMLMQKTNFDFEILIHDDASTDGTTEIIKEYEAKYPNIVKPLYEEENQWVKGRRGSAEFNFPRAKGKYIAMCEGDDYWTDPYKLQKQVDFLESNPECALCFHKHLNIDLENTVISKSDDKHPFHSSYNTSELIDHCPFQTATTVFKTEILGLDIYRKLTNLKFPFGDIPIFLSASTLGTINGINEYMSVYRHTVNGISKNLASQNNLIHSIKSWQTAATFFNREIYSKIHKLIIIPSLIYGLLHKGYSTPIFVKECFLVFSAYPNGLILFVHELLTQTIRYIKNRI